jgi:group I intron endonuclease
MKTYGIIYKAVNKINGKVYIGQTVKSLEYRRKQHIYYPRKYAFSNALHKYGADSFGWEVLECCSSKKELDEMEFHYIKQYDSLSPGGYNLTTGGEGTPGRKVSKHTLKKMSSSMLGFKHTLESRRMMSDSTKGSNNPMYGVPSPMTGKFGSDNHLSKKYVVTTPKGESFVVEGINYFCNNQKEKLYHTAMVKVARGKQSHHKGYLCRYYDEKLDLNLPLWRNK